MIDSFSSFVLFCVVYSFVVFPDIMRKFSSSYDSFIDSFPGFFIPFFLSVVLSGGSVVLSIFYLQDRTGGVWSPQKRSENIH